MIRVARLIFFSISFCLTSTIWSDALQDFLNSPSVEKGYVGVAVLDCTTNTFIYEHHSENYFIPASLTKIPLTFCALETLGPDFQYKTTLAYEGSIKECVLEGNLIIIGEGDPTLNSKDLDAWKELIKNQGISTITGCIKVDDSAFETAMASPYWNYQDLGNYYGAGASGLSFHENFYSVTFKPGKELGSAATIVNIDPPLKGVHTINSVKTAEAGTGDQVYVFGSEYFMTQFYRGTVPIDVETLTIKAAFPDPALFCGVQLAQKIRPDLQVERTSKEQSAPLKILDIHHSPSLIEIIKIINTKSHNLYAEHLLKTLGTGEATKGLNVLNNFLKGRGIDGVFYDGAGIARVNLISPKAMVNLLFTIRKSQNHKKFLDSLAKCGEGTLDSFSEIPGWAVRAKTGSLCKVFNLAGYLIHENGKEYAFCIMCNHINRSTKNLSIDINNFIREIAKDL